jgi:hypothetical protein
MKTVVLHQNPFQSQHTATETRSFSGYLYETQQIQSPEHHCDCDRRQEQGKDIGNRCDAPFTEEPYYLVGQHHDTPRHQQIDQEGDEYYPDRILTDEE